MGEFGRGLPFFPHFVGDFRLPFALGGQALLGAAQGAWAFVVAAAVAHVTLNAAGHFGYGVEQGVVVDVAAGVQLLVQGLAVGFIADQADDAAEGACLSVARKGHADATCVGGQVLVQGLHQVAEHLALD